MLSHPMQMTKEMFTKQSGWLSSCSVAFNYTSKERRNSNVLFRCEVLFAHVFCSNFSKQTALLKLETYFTLFKKVLLLSCVHRDMKVWHSFFIMSELAGFLRQI